ncbi:hypothetical protein BU17DRAFT_92598 [Hysterangium stoloniferum]|nr:hypothetical protein BU17DRAFT_92598 [Hysterangium stoloniferum]
MSSVSHPATTATENNLSATESMKQETEATQNSVQATVSPQAEQNALAPAQGSASQSISGIQIAADQFQAQAGAKTDAAVAQGQHDVAEAKGQGARYVAQAKESANDTINAAYEFVSAGTDSHTPFDPKAAAQKTGVASSIQSMVNSAYETAKSYLTSAQQATRPYGEKAQSALSSALGTETAQNDKGK